MGTAVTVVVAIWTIILVALAIWFFTVRARNRRADSSAFHFDAPEAPVSDDSGHDETQPVARLVASRRAAAQGAPLAPVNDLPPVQFPQAPAPPNVQQAPQAPPAPPSGPARPEVQPPPMRRSGNPDEPFGLTTQEEYERLAAESFQAPPAAALGESHDRTPFSWSDAAGSGLEPTPAKAVRRPTGITAEPDPLPEIGEPGDLVAKAPAAADARAVPAPADTGQARTGRAAEDDELDQTVMVPPRAGFDWALVLPDGARLALESDIIVGRRPSAVDGSALLQIPDATRTLSKSHARLRLHDERWWVTDLGSTNGLWLLHSDGREEALPPHREMEATPRMRFGTLDVELRRHRG
jgi:hypothetical protein